MNRLVKITLTGIATLIVIGASVSYYMTARDTFRGMSSALIGESALKYSNPAKVDYSIENMIPRKAFEENDR